LLRETLRKKTDRVGEESREGMASKLRFAVRKTHGKDGAGSGGATKLLCRARNAIHLGSRRPVVGAEWGNCLGVFLGRFGVHWGKAVQQGERRESPSTEKVLQMQLEIHRKRPLFAGRQIRWTERKGGKSSSPTRGKETGRCGPCKGTGIQKRMRGWRREKKGGSQYAPRESSARRELADRKQGQNRGENKNRIDWQSRADKGPR